MSRLAILAIDSLEWTIIRDNLERLPNFAELAKTTPQPTVASIFPPDSYPAWRSIFTGLNPAEHGLLFTPDVFESTKTEIEAMSNRGIEGNTFWDDASRAGKKVCILFPLTVFPAWQVNGVLVARSEERKQEDGVKYREIDASPADATAGLTVPDLRGFTGRHPGEAGLAEFKEAAMSWARADAEFAFAMAERHPWDLFFAYFPELDTIQHYFWRYCDPADPMYEPNPHSEAILDVYRLFDSVVGEFRRRHPDATLLVLSDHGHQMRPTRTVNVNEVLRRAGWLRARRSPARRAVERVKQLVLKTARRTGLEHALIRAGQKVPGAKNIYTAESLVDRERSTAWASGFRGPKSYPEGGVIIHRAALGQRPYDAVRAELTDALRRAIVDATGDPLSLDWIRPREELYSGPSLTTYPDIVFRLANDWGVGWDLGGRLTGSSYEHALSSGGHSPNACWLSSAGVAPPASILGVRQRLALDWPTRR